MSRLNLENLQRDYPQYGVAAARLQQWINNHPAKPFIDPRLIVRESEDVPVDQLTLFLFQLVEAGILKRVFKVESPFDHQLLETDYSSRKEVPTRLFDYRDREFSLDDANLVQVFRKAL